MSTIGSCHVILKAITGSHPIRSKWNSPPSRRQAQSWFPACLVKFLQRRGLHLSNKLLSLLQEDCFGKWRKIQSQLFEMTNTKCCELLNEAEEHSACDLYLTWVWRGAGRIQSSDSSHGARPSGLKYLILFYQYFQSNVFISGILSNKIKHRFFKRGFTW